MRVAETLPSPLEALAQRIIETHDNAVVNRALSAPGVSLIRSDHGEARVAQALQAAIAGETMSLQRAALRRPPLQRAI